MVIIDLLGWITFVLLVIGAVWAAWRVWGDVRHDPARTHERIDAGHGEKDSAEAP